MDPDKVKRRQSLKIIVSEAIMVLAVVATVTILAFLVSGYWINSDFEVERQGLLQVSSVPTGASVYIDGDSSWLQRTNISKVLTSGKHTITLTKDGYDSWSKTVNISEGLLYRLHYPRLFLQDSVGKKILSTHNILASSISTDGNKLLLLDDAMTWKIVNIANENLEIASLSTPDSLFGFTSAEARPDDFTVTSFSWSKDTNHVLISVWQNAAEQWLLLDAKSPDKSINLNRAFGRDLANVQILDHSASNLLAIIDGNLHKLDISSSTVSSPLVNNVLSYRHYDSDEVIFSASTSADPSDEYYVGIFQLNNDKTDMLTTTKSPASAALSKFYDDTYIIILNDNLLSLYQKDDFAKTTEYSLSFSPDNMTIGRDGEFVTMWLGNHIATLDMEANSITEWSIDSPSFDWLDDSLICTIVDGDFIVYDFDGLNRRIIAHDVSPRHPAAITRDKWLYYFSGDSLMRQAIAD